MKFICNVLVGLPLLGLLAGAGMFLVDAVRNFGQGPRQWEPCMNFLQWLFQKWSIWDKTSALTLMYCDLSLGAHIALASIVLGCLFIPLGLLLSRRFS